MKVRFIFSVLIALFIAGSVFAETESSSKYEGPRIVLKGEVGTETSRSITIIPIKAIFGDDNVMHITFDAPLGSVQISINGQLQEICQVATAGQETAFSVQGWAIGTYKLEFRTPNGGYVYGEFIIEE